jgi:hypothetical protein
MKLPFSISWGKPQKATEEQLKYKPVDSETLQLIDSYSAQVLEMLRANVDASLSFDSKAVKILSDDLEAGRLRYTEENKNIIGNMYGAFLGKAIIHTHLGGSGKWVTLNGDVGILWNEVSDTLPLIAFPMTRTFKHIAQGNEYSIYSYFLSIPAMTSSTPKR